MNGPGNLFPPALSTRLVFPGGLRWRCSRSIGVARPTTRGRFGPLLCLRSGSVGVAHERKSEEALREPDGVWRLVCLSISATDYSSARSWLSASMMDLLMRAAWVVKRATFIKSPLRVACRDALRICVSSLRRFSISCGVTLLLMVHCSFPVQTLPPWERSDVDTIN